MYLVSAYFDQNSENRMQKYIDAAAGRTGCRFMIENNIPPHMTMAQINGGGAGAGDGALYDAGDISGVLDEVIADGRVSSGVIDIVSFGVFKPKVMFLTPVLNEYLFNMSAALDEALVGAFGPEAVGGRYRPFSWLPHITIARGLSEPQMRQAFSCMQADHSVFRARIERIGLAESRPYKDIKVWDL